MDYLDYLAGVDNTIVFNQMVEISLVHLYFTPIKASADAIHSKLIWNNRNNRQPFQLIFTGQIFNQGTVIKLFKNVSNHTLRLVRGQL